MSRRCCGRSENPPLLCGAAWGPRPSGALIVQGAAGLACGGLAPWAPLPGLGSSQSERPVSLTRVYASLQPVGFQWLVVPKCRKICESQDGLNLYLVALELSFMLERYPHFANSFGLP